MALGRKKPATAIASRETIKNHKKSNRSWRDVREELKALSKELMAHVKQSDSKSDSFRMQAYAKIYEMYIKCDDDDLEQIATLEKLLHKADEREHLWNGMVKKFAGVKSAQASKVAKVFQYAEENDVPALGFEDFVEKKGGLNQCLREYKNLHPTTPSDTKRKKTKSLRLIGKSGLLRALMNRDGSALVRLVWDSQKRVAGLEKIFAEDFIAKRKRERLKKAEDENSQSEEAFEDDIDIEDDPKNEQEEEPEDENEPDEYEESLKRERRRLAAAKRRETKLARRRRSLSLNW